MKLICVYVNLGLDLDCGNYYTNHTVSAVQQGKVGEAEIDNLLKYLHIVLMRLGWLDGNLIYNTLGKNDISSYQNIQLAAEAAREGIVRLKNDDNTLPLDNAVLKNLALAGPHFNATLAMTGNYAGIPSRYISPIDGFSAYGNVNYSTMPPAIEAAENADATVIFAGLDLSVEGESLDRIDLYLLGFQAQLVNKVADAAKGPVILLIMSGGGVDVSFATNNSVIISILWAGYPGQEGGHAIADEVFGNNHPGKQEYYPWYQFVYTFL